MSYTTQPRRSNRAVQDETWMREVLTQSATAVIGLATDNQPYLNPNLYVYDAQQHVCYFHTAGSSRVRDMLAINPHCCVNVYHLGRVVWGPSATDFSVEYASVTLFGQAQLVQDTEEVMRVFAQYLDKYGPGLQASRDYSPFTQADAARASMFKLSIDAWSGKQHLKPTDYAYAHACPNWQLR